MEYIELVIKIPESEIPKQQDIIEIPLHFIDGKVCEAGGYEFDVLPKGHGRLKDVDNIFSYSEDLYEAIDCAPTVIEASEPWEKWLYPNRKENKK